MQECRSHEQRVSRPAQLSGQAVRLANRREKSFGSVKSSYRRWAQYSPAGNAPARPPHRTGESYGLTGLIRFTTTTSDGNDAPTSGDGDGDTTTPPARGRFR